MSESEQVSVRLPRAVMERVRAAVAAGEFASVEEAVAAAVVLWDAEQRMPEIDDATLRLLYEEGVASGEPLEADDVFRRLRERIGGRHAAE